MIEKEKKSRTKKSVSAVVQSGATETSEPRKTPRKPSPVAMSANGTDSRKKKTIGKKTTPKVTEIGVSREEIAKLAHRFWNERGRVHGYDAEDWLRAERELRGKAS